jgi:hypothetical protein
MMKLESFSIGQRFFQASIYKNGRDIDDGTGDCFPTREEAELDGDLLVASYDPEWQKRNHGQIEYTVRECEVDSVEGYGALGGYHTVD